jgi:glycosyltransferase involved in cell wall biosynthesis
MNYKNVLSYHIVKNKLKSFLNLKVNKPQQKTYEMWAERGYNPSPEITFIVQSHNKSAQISLIIKKLREVDNSEIIVIDDGSSKNHTINTIDLLRKGNEFVLRANDLYEIITYDRAITLARGEYVVLLQDDDYFDQIKWIEEGLKLFKQYENLAILGGRNGSSITFSNHFKDENSHHFKSSEDAEYDYQLLSGTSINVNNSEFKFVETINRAPMWIRRSFYLTKLGGINQNFAPFQFDDVELCLRAWTLGLQVGLYSAGFKISTLGFGGMRIWNNSLTERQSKVNSKILYDLYGDKIESEYFKNIVKQANESL